MRLRDIFVKNRQRRILFYFINNKLYNYYIHTRKIGKKAVYFKIR